MKSIQPMVLIVFLLWDICWALAGFWSSLSWKAWSDGLGICPKSTLCPCLVWRYACVMRKCSSANPIHSHIAPSSSWCNLATAMAMHSKRSQMNLTIRLLQPLSYHTPYQRWLRTASLEKILTAACVKHWVYQPLWLLAPQPTHHWPPAQSFALRPYCQAVLVTRCAKDNIQAKQIRAAEP